MDNENIMFKEGKEKKMLSKLFKRQNNVVVDLFGPGKNNTKIMFLIWFITNMIYVNI